MMRSAIAFLILAAVLAALAVLVAMEHRPSGYAMPWVAAAMPVTVPWSLNTRCTINSKNLPTRNPKEIA